jgi:hypothetical protein
MIYYFFSYNFQNLVKPISFDRFKLHHTLVHLTFLWSKLHGFMYSHVLGVFSDV